MSAAGCWRAWAAARTGALAAPNPAVAGATLYHLEEETIVEVVGVKVPKLSRFVSIVEQTMPLQLSQRRVVQAPARGQVVVVVDWHCQQGRL